MQPNNKKKNLYISERKKVLEYLSDGKLVKWKQLKYLDIQSNTIANMVRKGELVKIGWGSYHLSPDLIPEKIINNSEIVDGMIEEFSEVALQIPKGIICLMSAVSYHKMTTDITHQIWIAIPHSNHKPRIEYPPIRSVHWRNMELGNDEIEIVQFKNQNIKITSKERTVVDLYRHQHLLSDPQISKKTLSWLLTQENHDREKLADISRKFNVYNKIKSDIQMFDNAQEMQEEIQTNNHNKNETEDNEQEKGFNI